MKRNRLREIKDRLSLLISSFFVISITFTWILVFLSINYSHVKEFIFPLLVACMIFEIVFSSYMVFYLAKIHDSIL